MIDQGSAPHGKWNWIGNGGVRLYLLLAVAMESLLLLPYLPKKKAFAFYDIGSDTFLQFYPLQIAIAGQLKTLHAVTWSFNFGLGGFLGSLLDPMLLVTGWLPESWQLATRLPMFAVRVLLGGAFFCAYLRTIGMQARLAVFGGLAYAFSTYGLLNAQWEVMHGTEFVQFAIFLYLFERFVRGGSRWYAVIAGLVVGVGHPMGLYMFALLGLVYGSARLTMTPHGSRAPLIRSIIRFALWCATGLAVMGPLLFPAVYYLLASPRVSGEYSLMPAVLAQILQFNDGRTIALQLSALLGKDLLGTGLGYTGPGNYFEAPGFYIGLLPLLCIPQLFGPNATTRERWFGGVAIVAIGLYFLLPALRSAVYGFGDSTFRFSTLWISALLLVLGLAGLRRALDDGTWLIGLAIGTGFIFGIVGLSLLVFGGGVNFHHIYLALSFACVYAVYLSFAREMGPHQWVPLLAIFACELFLFAVPPLTDRVQVNIDGSINGVRYNDGTNDAVAYVRQLDPPTQDNGGFYRIEKTYYSVFLDDSLIQNYAGTASYAFHGASITRFVDQMGLPRALPSANYINAMIDRRDVLDLLGVRYILSGDRKPDAWRNVSFVTAIGPINIYRNTSTHAFAQFYDAFASETDARPMSVTQRDAYLLQNLIVDDPAAVHARLAQLSSTQSTLELERDARMRKVRDDVLSGSVTTPTASALLLTMPFDRGWRATIDGAPAELFRADFGLTALLVPSGRHALALVYLPPGRIAGWWFAAGSILLLVIVQLIERRKVMRAEAVSTPA